MQHCNTCYVGTSEKTKFKINKPRTQINILGLWPCTKMEISQPPQPRPHHNIADIFAEERNAPHGFLRVSAPMVRYSKLEFRKLLREHGVKLTFTPMIIADSFNNSEKARQNEFTTSADDQPLIAQFAACNANEFVTAAQLIYPYVDGVDVNCGCPQSWAIAKGYGCGLLRQPELVRDIIQTVRRTLPTDFSVSLKIRLLTADESVRTTVELARQLEKCGANFLTLHGRTMWQKTSEPLNIPAMTEVKRSLQIPLIVNGNVRTWQDACELHALTGADGVMAARGLLANPTLYNPEMVQENGETPEKCIQQWLNIGARAGDNIHFQCFHHHLTFMWASHMQRKLRLEFNNFTRKQQIFDFFEERFGLRPSPEALVDPFEYTKCTYTHYTAPSPPPMTLSEAQATWNSNSHGKFFNEFTADDEEDKEDLELGSFFTELDD